MTVQQTIIGPLLCALQAKKKKNSFLSLMWLQYNVLCAKRDVFQVQKKNRGRKNELVCGGSGGKCVPKMTLMETLEQ